MYHEVKSKISSTLVQSLVHFFNETKRTATKFEGFEKAKNNSNSLSKFYWLFFSAVKSVYFNQFFCLVCIQAVFDIGPYQNMLKKYPRPI